MKATVNIQRCPPNISSPYILAKLYHGILWYQDCCDTEEDAIIAVEKEKDLAIILNPLIQP